MTPSSLVVIRSASRPSVHLVHPAGGSSRCYQALAAMMPSHWTVTASDDVGAGSAIPGMARLYLKHVLAGMGVPDLVGGWSLGGLVAYEMVRQLHTGGPDRLPALFLIDSPAPPGRAPAMAAGELASEFAAMLWGALGLRSARLPAMDGDEARRLRALAAALRAEDACVDAGWLSSQFATFRRHRAAVAGYTARHRLTESATLVAGDLPEDQLRAWRPLLGSRAVIVRLPGGHFDLLRPPLVHDVADLLVALAARAEADRRREG